MLFHLSVKNNLVLKMRYLQDMYGEGIVELIKSCLGVFGLSLLANLRLTVNFLLHDVGVNVEEEKEGKKGGMKINKDEDVVIVHDQK